MAVQDCKQLKKALLIARYYIKKNEKEGHKKKLDMLKLQKLLYYSQAWNLVFNDKKLFSEQIEAWIHGPVVPEVWKELKGFDFSINHPEISEDIFSCINNNEQEVLDDIWRVYGKFDGEYLEILTHNESPWQEARKGISEFEPSQNVISTESMKEYYSKRLKDEMAKSNKKT